MNRIMQAWLAVVLVATAPSAQARASEGLSVDVVHFWISKSESAALDVLRKAWAVAGNQWIDMPAENKVAVQRLVSDRIANGYAPAVMQWNANEGSRELPEMGIVQDIDDLAQADRWRDVIPATVLDRISYKGKIYFAPTNIHAENWLWTSTTVFREAEVKMPRSWDEIFNVAEKIKAAGRVPIALGGMRWEVSLIFNDIIYHKFGPEGYARLMSGDAELVHDPRMIEALDLLLRLSRYVEPLETRKNKTWADATAMVGAGEAGMQFMGDWAKGDLIARSYQVDRDFDCSLVPGTAIGYFMVIDAFAFPLTNRDGTADAQRAFARMVMDQGTQVAFSHIKGSLPVRTDVDPAGLDRCGQLGLEMIRAKKGEVSAQSQAMPSQISEGWIGVVGDFFNNGSMSSTEAQRRLYDVLMQR
ncbi:carbohydrate ABC transporter substrate-binding protein [Rhizobium leguminosarum]|uniref:ABC transporter substrate-binding protein n=1 Tax=Rhizobium leguminosarum TaxID=384 RepID=UPI001C944182|nr:ABC transporter substrate-binding protein [Rhizobium leguminosarum]MBY5460860.1 carbohydrate ABC transporter substrate-binding protein [Rhizobium leguminosarum]